ncbi:hypothetical protein COB72_04575 [bacterium]|nr:MAG: hypothetical protein COB72_04575 [bacterium]
MLLFFFDIVCMNHAFSLATTLTISSLLLASGCASSQERAQACDSHEAQPISASASAPIAESESQSFAPEFAPVDPDVELVIGNIFADEFIPHYPDPIASYTIEEIQAELEAMFDLDQSVVSNTVYPSSQVPTSASTIRAIDIAQSDRLKEIVEHIGWPTRESVGLKATQAAYMVIQHAGHDAEFQNQSLAMMIDLVEDGELPASYVALLTDRIRVFQDQPQVFGTQMAMASNEYGVMVPTPTVPIEDPEHLDSRRKLMGMPPHQEFVSAIAVAYQASLVDPGTAFAEVMTDD